MATGIRLALGNTEYRKSLVYFDYRNCLTVVTWKWCWPFKHRVEKVAGCVRLTQVLDTMLVEPYQIFSIIQSNN